MLKYTAMIGGKPVVLDLPDGSIDGADDALVVHLPVDVFRGLVARAFAPRPTPRPKALAPGSSVKSVIRDAQGRISQIVDEPVG